MTCFHCDEEPCTGAPCVLGQLADVDEDGGRTYYRGDADGRFRSAHRVARLGLARIVSRGRGVIQVEITPRGLVAVDSQWDGRTIVALQRCPRCKAPRTYHQCKTGPRPCFHCDACGDPPARVEVV